VLGPNEDKFWVLSGRVNHLWQSLYDDRWKPHLIQRYLMSFIEIHPDDAADLGVISGDPAAVESDRVRTQDQQPAMWAPSRRLPTSSAWR
jgi:anaerobic selenocysteine-containing dehydrogenase